MIYQEYKLLYQQQLEIILNQFNQNKMFFKCQPSILFVKTHSQMQKKLMAKNKTYRFGDADLTLTLALAIPRKNTIVVNLKNLQKYHLKQQHNEIEFAKEVLLHEVWHLYESESTKRWNRIDDSILQLTKNYFYKKLRNLNLSEKEIIKRIKKRFTNKIELSAYLFADACLYKMPFAIEFFQKNFNVDINKISP